MTNSIQFKHGCKNGYLKTHSCRRVEQFRQRGMTLIDFMVGLTVGLLVALAAVGSLIMIRSSAYTMSDSAELDQQASLIMMQIGQQVSQAGAINAYLVGTDPDAGISDTKTSGAIATTGGGDGKINFDVRAIGVNTANAITSVFGTDGGAGPDTFTVSYAAPNDGSPARNCAGYLPVPAINGGVPRIVSKFYINMTSNSSGLICSNDVNSVSIASDVVDMRVQYLLVQEDNSVVYRSATQINQNPVNWENIKGIQVCLEMQGDITQAPPQTLTVDCRGNGPVTRNDGRVHRIVRQTFYLRNT